jgi:hypothetical protein
MRRGAGNNDRFAGGRSSCKRKLTRKLKTGINLCISYKRKIINRLLVYWGITVFLLTKISVFSRSTKKKTEYPNILSAVNRVPHGDLLLYYQLTTRNFQFFIMKKMTVCRARQHLPYSCLIAQSELNGLVRDLDVEKRQAVLLEFAVRRYKDFRM